MRLPSGHEQAREFLEARSETQQAIFVRSFLRISNGQRVHRRLFKSVEGSDHLWEFKDYDNNRIVSFHAPGRLMVLAEGLHKRGNKLPPERVKAIEKLRIRFLDAAPRPMQIVSDIQSGSRGDRR